MVDYSNNPSKRIVNLDAELHPDASQWVKDIADLTVSSIGSQAAKQYFEEEVTLVAPSAQVIAEIRHLLSNVILQAPAVGVESTQILNGTFVAVLVDFGDADNDYSTINISTLEKSDDALSLKNINLQTLQIELSPIDGGTSPDCNEFCGALFFDHLTPGKKYRIQVSG